MPTSESPNSGSALSTPANVSGEVNVRDVQSTILQDIFDGGALIAAGPLFQQAISFLSLTSTQDRRVKESIRSQYDLDRTTRKPDDSLLNGPKVITG